MTEMTPAQRQAFEAARARASEKAATQAATPKQRVRSMAQGLTFGAADEIEARARALATGRPYAEILDEVRGGLKAYKQAYPYESLGYEIAGALGPALLPGGQASLLRAAGRGAAEGAAYAFGTGEGSAAERLARVPGGAVLGGAAGGAGYGVVRALGNLANRLLDAARRTVGRRGAAVVEAEIQRLVDQTGQTPDEIVQEILDGRLLAENKTIRQAVRGLFTQGGPAQVTLKEGLEGRPAETSAAALELLKRNLGAGAGTSEAAARRASEEATRLAERQSYAPLTSVAAPDEVVTALADTIRRVPEAAREVAMAARAAGTDPFFTVSDDGAVAFTRRPTAAEAEAVRRALSNRASALYRQEGMGLAGEATAEVEGSLRSILDFTIPELKTARAQAAAVRADRDAYTAGLKAMVGDVNEVLADYAALSGKDNAASAIAAFRAGLMQAIEARAATGSRASLIRNLTNPQTKEGMLLNAVFPQDELPIALKALSTASEAQATAGRVLQGSDTASSLAEQGRQGADVSLGEVAGALSGDTGALLGMAQRMVNAITASRALTDAERNRIAKLLVSRDPDMVRRAMEDTSGFAALTHAAATLIDQAVAASRAGAAQQGGEAGGDLSERALRGLLAQ